jgi:hypothetical protein
VDEIVSPDSVSMVDARFPTIHLDRLSWKVKVSRLVPEGPLLVASVERAKLSQATLSLL